MLASHLIAASIAAASPASGPAIVQDAAAPVAPSGAQGPQDETGPASGLPADAPRQEDAAPSDGAAQAEPPAPASGSDEAAIDELGPQLEHTGLGNDPLEGFNRVSFAVSQAIDAAVIRPSAIVYRHVVPKPARDGVHNALSNIGEPLVFLNDLLQLRPDRMVKTLGRFLINSTLGVGGLFDIAKRKPFNLPHHANSFGDTLGYYGVKPGPYLYLPIVGPTTLRDAIGSSEQLIPPLAAGNPFDRQAYIVPTMALDGLDQRERNDDDLKAMLRDAIDPYATLRANYFQERAGEIASLKARKDEPHAPDIFEDPLTDPAAAAPSAEGKTAPAYP